MLLVLQAVYNYIKAQLVEGRYFHCRNCGLWLQRLFSPLDSASVSISADPSMQLKAHKALETMEHCSLFGRISWLAFISSPALFLLPSNSLTHTHAHTHIHMLCGCLCTLSHYVWFVPRYWAWCMPYIYILLFCGLPICHSFSYASL